MSLWNVYCSHFQASWRGQNFLPQCLYGTVGGDVHAFEVSRRPGNESVGQSGNVPNLNGFGACSAVKEIWARHKSTISQFSESSLRGTKDELPAWHCLTSLPIWTRTWRKYVTMRVSAIQEQVGVVLVPGVPGVGGNSRAQVRLSPTIWRTGTYFIQALARQPPYHSSGGSISTQGLELMQSCLQLDPGMVDLALTG